MAKNGASRLDEGLDDSATGLARIEQAIAESPGLRPVSQWRPEREGRIDIRIGADGCWYYLGSAIERERLVRLFASVLLCDEKGQHYLVTPAEKLAITVDDAPFLAVHMDVAGEGTSQVLGVRTNVGDYVKIDDNHRLRFETDSETGGIKPYVTVRDRLVALMTRSLTFDLIELASTTVIDGSEWFGVWSSGTFFAIAPQSELE